MHYSIYATLGSMVFLTVLLILHLSKNKRDYIKHKIFNYVLYIAYALLLTEILATEFFVFTANYTLAYWTLKIHWFLALVWVTFLYLFFICFVEKSKEKTINGVENVIFVKISLIILAVLMVVYFFIPFDPINVYNIDYLPGPASYFSLCFVILVLTFMLIYERISTKKNKDTLTSLLIIFAESITLLSLQFSFQNIDLYGVLIVGVIFGIYTTAENPDLDVIDELKELSNEMNSSSKVKTNVILSMSHDIRSPMNAIVNYSDGLANLKELNSEQIKDDINNILVSGKNLLNIIGDVLDISSNNSNNDTYLENYQLKTILDDLNNITKSRIGNKPIKLETIIGNEVPQELRGNPTKLYRIIMNILSNSAKYTDVGKIVTKINATMSDEDTIVLHFKISDTGFGIKDEDKAKLFSEFSRLSDATNQKIEGTGLGLVNTKKNIESLGGKIWFDSIYGAGTTFYIDIPQKMASNTNSNAENKNVRLSENLIDCRNNNVLIVDDNELNISVTSRLLKRYGFNVDYALSSEQCISKIKQDNKYDIIFMDVSFNGEDGFEVLDIIKKLNKVYDIPPIVALTANVIIGSRQNYLNKGFDEYLSKPIDINELDRIINLFFSKYI